MDRYTIMMELTPEPTPRAVPLMIPLAYEAIARLDSIIKESSYTQERAARYPLWRKYLLTIEEAAEYFGIGEKRLRRIAADNRGENFIMEVGSQLRIKRVLFEQYLDSVGTI